ncbi:MAG: hypothetical protein ACT4N5_03025 [Nitrosopumilaceae archaeon]
MIKEIYFCNRCKKEISAIDLEIVATQYQRFDYCSKCFITVENFLKGNCDKK